MGGKAFQDAQLDRTHGELHMLISPGQQTQRWVGVLGAGLVSRPDSYAGRESGQIPIIISCLTRQEFLGVLIDLVANGAHWLPFLACYLGSEAF